MNLNTISGIYREWLGHHRPCHNTITRGQAFQTLGRTFDFVLRLQNLGRLFERLIRELKTRPFVLII